MRMIEEIALIQKQNWSTRFGCYIRSFKQKLRIKKRCTSKEMMPIKNQDELR